MPNYANTQLYELIEHDENGNPVVYRGHTTQPLHKRMSGHRKGFKNWKDGKGTYCSSYEVLKHGPARIELVKVVSCFNKKEATREEGKFIRELPTCVNIQKNYENYAEYYHINKEIIHEQQKEYRKANKDIINAKANEHYHANKETLKAKANELYHANRDAILAKASEKITCECGAVICRGRMSRHRKTWTHFRDFIHL